MTHYLKDTGLEDLATLTAARDALIALIEAAGQRQFDTSALEDMLYDTVYDIWSLEGFPEDEELCEEDEEKEIWIDPRHY